MCNVQTRDQQSVGSLREKIGVMYMGREGGNQKGQDVVNIFRDEFCRTIAGRDNGTVRVAGLMYFGKEIGDGVAG